LFDIWGDASWRGGSLGSNRELLRIPFELFQKTEKPSFLNTQDLLDILSFNLLVGITLQKLFHLVWSKPFVHLGHNLRPPLGFQTISLTSRSDAAELSTEGYESSEILPFGPPRSIRRALG
jgi:hypothetical protein